MHNIKIYKKKAMLLKMDLVKAYDRVNWSFLRLILIRIGLPSLIIKWIMACITSMNISVLVNGSPSEFFSCSRGIRQGCPLYPLLFILIMDGFSRLVNNALVCGQIKGIKISKDCVISHIMFADDVLVGGVDSLEEWTMYKHIIQTFCRASGMLVSSAKSNLYHHSLKDEQIRGIRSIMPYNCYSIEQGFKYLGFILKPNNSQIKDWYWLLRKVEARIAQWSYRLLSIGGKLILVKSVLSSIPVYWFSLLEVPVFIIKTIKRYFFFLWSGTTSCEKIHMVAADTLSRPYRFGGWGIKDLETFNISLRLKSFWRGIFIKTLWSRLIHDKYIKSDVICWIRNPELVSWNYSPMWRGFMKIFHWIKNDLLWQVGSGSQIRVGIDPIIGFEHDYCLPPIIPQYLQILGLSTLNKIHHQSLENEANLKWLSAREIGLSGYLTHLWDDYIKKLNSAGVRLNNDVDKLVWGGNPASGIVSAHTTYTRILQENFIFPQDWWYKRIWQWSIPLNLKCFIWLVLQDKLKTWDNLCKRGWIGPSCCVLCKNAAETRQHIFVQCSFSRKI